MVNLSFIFLFLFLFIFESIEINRILSLCIIGFVCCSISSIFSMYLSLLIYSIFIVYNTNNYNKNQLC